MQDTNRRIEAENQKGEGVIFEKRVFDLAKQAVAALHGEPLVWRCHSAIRMVHSYITSLSYYRHMQSWLACRRIDDLPLHPFPLDRLSQALVSCLAR